MFNNEQRLILTPNIISLFPHTVKKFLEIQKLANAEDKIFGEISEELTQYLYNQFVLTSDYYGVLNFENLLDIMANPETDDLHFRKQRILNRLITLPPFTMRVLRNKFDSIIGKNKWVAYIDYDRYTLTLESTGKNQRWYGELLFIAYNIIPANLLFINNPVEQSLIIANEKVSYQEIDYCTESDESIRVLHVDHGLIKAPQTKSIMQPFLNGLAEFSESILDSVVLNKTYTISNDEFIDKASVINYLIAIYEVHNEMDMDAISNVALIDNEGDPMTISTAYVPIKTKQLYKHIMKFREGDIVPLDKIVQFSFLKKLAIYSKDLISKALINDTIEIEFQDKAAFNNNMVVRYKILKEEMNISVIRNIKLLDENGVIKTQCDCYLEVNTDQLITHVFTFDEGVESFTNDATSGYGVLPVSLQGYGE